MISILSSLSSILTGTIPEEFKKLVQPGSLVAAAIFMTLNLVLIYPALIEQRVAFALTIQSLSATGQLALGTLTLVILGYLINNLGGVFLSLVTGNAFRDSGLIQATLVRLQQHKFDNLKRDLKSKNESTQARALHRLASEFPKEHDRIAPTRLGNALASVASYTWHQYGAYLDILWPMMDQPLKTQNSEMHTRIQQNWTSLLLFTGLTTLLAVVALEVLTMRVWLGRPRLCGVLVLFLLIASHLIYRASVQKALDWSRDMRAAFDLYLKEVEDGLDLRQLSTYGKEQERKERWKAVSWWLTHGAVEIPDSAGLKKPVQEAKWYNASPVPEPVVASPSTVSVQARHKVLEHWSETRESKQEYRLPGRVVQYLFAVTNSESGKHAQPARGSFLIVADSRLPTVPDEVLGKLTGADIKNEEGKDVKGKRQLGSPEALLWRLGDIPVRGSRILKYTVHYDIRVRVESDDVEIDEFLLTKLRIVTVAFRYIGRRTQNLGVAATVLNESQLPEEAQCLITHDGGARDVDIATVYEPARRRGSWTIPKVQPQSKLYFTLTFKHV